MENLNQESFGTRNIPGTAAVNISSTTSPGRSSFFNVFQWRATKTPTLSNSASQDTILADPNSSKNFENRSFVNVMKTIIRIIDNRDKTSVVEDTNDHWLPDELTKECYDCLELFTTFRRRHHCRLCGQIFCTNCCNQLIPAKLIGYPGLLRVCGFCSRLVMTHVKSAIVETEIELNTVVDIELVKEKIMEHLLTAVEAERNDPLMRQNRPRNRKVSLTVPSDDRLRELESSWSAADELMKNEQDLTYLTTLVHLIIHPINGIGLSSRRHHLKTYHKVLVGSELVDWLVGLRKVAKRTQAVALGQELVSSNLLECVSHSSNVFRDEYFLYRPTMLAMKHPKIVRQQQQADMLDEPHWLSQIELKETDTASSIATDDVLDRTDIGSVTSEGAEALFSVDLDLSCNAASISRSVKEKQQTVFEGMTDDKHKLSNMPVEFLNENILSDEESEQIMSDEKFSVAFETIETKLLIQLLEKAGLSDKWFDTILILARQISLLIKPDVRNESDDLDIRKYVKIKRIPGGKMTDSYLVNGVVFSKNIVHNEMNSYITDPQILLLNSSISCEQYDDSSALSLESVLMQGIDVLNNITELMLSFNPDVIVTGKHVEKYARDLFLSEGVTLVTNVKQRTLQKIARCTQAEVIDCIDDIIHELPDLGMCHKFYTKQFTMEGGCKKTLNCFDGCASHLGCTVLLRGGHMNQLKRVKEILQYMVAVEYNWSLQKALLINITAIPRSVHAEFATAVQNNSLNDESKQQFDTKTISDDSKQEFDNKTINDDSGQQFNNRANKEDASIEDSGENVNKIIKEKDDPLHSPRKNVSDESDVCQKENTANASKFQKLLSETVICYTPDCDISVPYLATKDGQCSSLRRFFSYDLYRSVEFDKTQKTKRTHIRKAPIDCNKSTSLSAVTISDIDVHSFIKESIAMNDQQSIDSVASYRSKGCRLKKQIVVSNLCGDIDSEPCTDQWIIPGDVLHPINHDQIAIQRYTYSKQRSGGAIFCVDPRIFIVGFNTEGDTSLGAFLENECFNSNYKCRKKDCTVSELHHERRYYHDKGCVTLSVVLLSEPCKGNNIWVWTWCQECDKTSNARPVSSMTWTLSFGKFLEMFFTCSEYSSLEGCKHRLFRNRNIYFGCKKQAALFMYRSIELNEIILPLFEINVNIIKIMTLNQSNQHLHELSEGIQVFSTVVEKLVEINSNCFDSKLEESIKLEMEELKIDKCNYREKVQEIEILVERILNNGFEQSILFEVSDKVCLAKRLMADAIYKWKARLSSLIKSVKTTAQQKLKEKTETEDLSSLVGKSKNNESSGVKSKEKDGGSSSMSPPVRHWSGTSDDQSDAKSKVKSAFTSSGYKALKAAFTNNSGDDFSLSSPFPVNEHHRLPLTVPPMYINGEDIGSIISYTLLSKDYHEKTIELQQHQSFLDENLISDVNNDDVEVSDQMSVVSGISSYFRSKTDKDNASTLTNESDLNNKGSYNHMHIEVNFSDENANFFCQVLFAIQFHNLRSLIFPEGEERFVRCLMFCKPWTTKGGKSGSTFQKSCDDRFVIKTISKIEKDHFLRIGLNYIQYLKDNHSKQQPSVLAKILGLFLVGYRNNVTGFAKKSYVIVMENLFYGCSSQIQKFDLKGSLRNRLANTNKCEKQNDSDLVLLDENMVRMMCEKPFYVRPHSKYILMQSINRDTEFLQSNQIMDYSLLVGICKESKQLIVGIIDYLRSYTYDKAMETYLKSYAVLLGNHKRPTILDPVRYKKRFIEMMNKYFLDIPDRWLSFMNDNKFNNDIKC